MAIPIKSDLDRHLGARFRIARQEAGLSQEKLGEHLGITFQQIQKYEKGTNRISAATLHRVATLTGKAPAWFYAQLGDDHAETEDAQRAMVPHHVLRDLAALKGSHMEASIHRMIAAAAAGHARGAVAA